MSDLKVVLYGCLGRMGTEISNLIEKTPNIEVVAGFDVAKSREDRPYPIHSDISCYPASANVIINFMSPTAVDEAVVLLKHCETHGIPIVYGTTSLPYEIESAIAHASKNIAIFKAPNMAPGLNMLADLLGKASKMLYNLDFDVEIIEKHHNKKLDAPSGTAILLAEKINTSLGGNMHMTTDRSAQHSERNRMEIGMHSVRGGTIAGEHTVIFAGPNETIEFTHTATSREVFAIGAVKAAQFIYGKPAGVYTMQDLLRSL